MEGGGKMSNKTKTITIGVPVELYLKVNTNSELKRILIETFKHYMSDIGTTVKNNDYVKSVNVTLRLHPDIVNNIKHWANFENMTILEFTSRLLNLGG